jgi:hypothetical protein
MAARGTGKPNVYWDRSANVVRDWKTDQALPDYQGTCLVYLDVEGPVFLQTFLQDGKRYWEQEPVAAYQVSSTIPTDLLSH